MARHGKVLQSRCETAQILCANPAQHPYASNIAPLPRTLAQALPHASCPMTAAAGNRQQDWGSTCNRQGVCQLQGRGAAAAAACSPLKENPLTSWCYPRSGRRWQTAWSLGSNPRPPRHAHAAPGHTCSSVPPRAPPFRAWHTHPLSGTRLRRSVEWFSWQMFLHFLTCGTVPPHGCHGASLSGTSRGIVVQALGKFRSNVHCGWPSPALLACAQGASWSVPGAVAWQASRVCSLHWCGWSRIRQATPASRCRKGR